MAVTRYGSWITLAIASAILAASTAAGQTAPTPPTKTRVVLLGTGTPAANPDRSGPATVIVVNDVAYLVDFGPGVVRRANAAGVPPPRYRREVSSWLDTAEPT